MKILTWHKLVITFYAAWNKITGYKRTGSGWSRDTLKSEVYWIAASFVTLGGVVDGRNC